jgi:hypothetical protein
MLASVTSIAAFALLVWWGISLSQLDPNDVPIIKKAQGPARVAPEDPGGEQASFQGLSVNEIQAAGGASKPADKVYLAPKPRPFQAEDVAGLQVQKTSHVIAEPDQAPILKDADLKPIAASATVDGAADQPIKPAEVAAKTTDASENPDEVAAPTVDPVDPAKADAAANPLATPSIARPKTRPKGLKLAAASSPAKAPSDIAVGTALVQLGAFDADAVATVQWNNLAKRHADLMGGKKPLIQKTTKGTKTYYRLRVQGFKNAKESKSFCAALKARDTDCIPVTAR